MLRERVSNNIYVFTSELYAQVTAGAIITPEGAIVVDTLPFPSETKQIKHFIESRHGLPVRYVINTHYHADHTYGTCLFEEASVVSHRLCYDLLNTRGRVGLERDRQNSREMAQLELRLPDIIFEDGSMNIHLGGLTVQLWHAPGHSSDTILCLVEEERILFASDTLMPVPFFTDGSWDDYVATLQSLQGKSYENIVQGHGDVILRGELESKLESDLTYLIEVRQRVQEVVESGGSQLDLDSIDIEACGKSRLPLNGLVEQLHHSNLRSLYQSLSSETVPVAE
ncbi:MAG: MBL fold metallo-hydrolase [Chloroflexi bacterium]|nr:MBL fold metallo-hydrolase [Chloroflexota bacterium]